ncbi:DUF1622 domain-containing protein [Yersinia nurmii]|uniref:DUF1622 domain-containing protein n=1 Tax=Yersinia nurmii TaxID=685706 RepID=A0AAW7JX03_9GAMM|nr:DUF1622 domain-containing protein [Yersinia nurmii]MDN0087253.1 DUF1622 domain-containing protein [Yersinia nurmii]CNE99282.1 sll0939 protein [Yersinia nurmii]
MNIHTFIMLAASGLNIVSVLVLIYGVVKCLFAFIKNELQRGESTIQRIRLELGGYLLLALEILIPADILKTIIEPDYKELIILASIVVIRIVLSISLSKELKSLNAEE